MEFSDILEPLRHPSGLRKKGELLGQAGVLKQGLR
jgi:hypothetical protein